MSLSIFKQIMRNPKVCESARKFEFKEKDRSSKLQRVVVKGFQNDNAVRVAFDGKKELSFHLAQSGDHLKTCDAVVVTSIDGETYLIFMEMKSEQPNRTRITKQFMSMQCFMDYCDSILKRFHDSELLRLCKKRFVVFYKAPSIPKTPTRPVSTGSNNAHDRPDNPLYVPYIRPVHVKKLLR